MANDRLCVQTKLSTVPALQIREGDWKEEEEWQVMNLREEWFWLAEEGSFLKEPRVPAYEVDKTFF
ncbi:uncharacterized protein K444DRAFT_258833 [Hyaloscypha bicolor E]|jgi:hypothetical protein|uniref:Uncharacterized protein n=1 Tax=Hyaloscypha bicolor E TaxID=1095630 RepID=A0A2J6SNJ1_9HELO|nr:uncharacterized protein K444DRAFT_258833 [Hyaloscypha bicolor E]PMD52335.1 hypothetical protein K444DRAFT_258833 [Hyaloscypha bicolor E]